MSINQPGTTPLHAACSNNDYAQVVIHVSEGADLEARKPHGATALWIAAEKGNSKIVSHLVENGSCVNAVDSDNVTPLYIAAQNGFLSVCRLLLYYNADPRIPKVSGATPVLIAAQEGHVEIVRALYEAGSPLNQPMKNGITPFIASCFKGHGEVAAYLGFVGADTEAEVKGKNGMEWARQEGHAHLISHVLEARADRVLLRRYFRRYSLWLSFISKGNGKDEAAKQAAFAFMMDSNMALPSASSPKSGGGGMGAAADGSGGAAARNPEPASPPSGALTSREPRRGLWAALAGRRNNSVVNPSPSLGTPGGSGALTARGEGSNATKIAAEAANLLSRGRRGREPSRDELNNLTGFLYKRGGSGFHTWKKRHFSVTRALGVTEIDYRVKEDTPVIASILCKDIVSVERYDLSIKKERAPRSEFAKNALAIRATSPKDKMYLLCALSDKQCEDWVDVINRAASAAQSTNQSHKSVRQKMVLALPNS